MKESHISVLGVAPYEAMKAEMIRAASHYPEIDLEVYVGNLKEGADIVLQNLHRNYDVIISRGCTAERIRKVTHTPVVEVPLSIYDILRTIKMLENYPGNYAIVGFPMITDNAHSLENFLQHKIKTVTIHSESEIEEVLNQLKSSGINMVLSDTITTVAARRLGMNSVLMASGPESIDSALRQTVDLCSSYADLRDEIELLKEALKGEASHTIIFDEKQNLIYSSLDNPEHEIHLLCRQNIPDVLQNSNYKAFHVIEDTLYSIHSQLIRKGPHSYPVFYMEAAKVPQITSKYGITYTNRREAEKLYYKSLQSINESVPDLKKELDQLSSSRFHIMIYGENGTGKSEAARFLYTHSTQQQNPMIVINCRLLNSRSWEFLTNNYHSPLVDEGNILYFQNLESLSPEWSRQLLSIILDTNVHTRNRLIFSCTCSKSASLPAYAKNYFESLNCLPLYLPPLREHKEEIASLSSIYLASLTLELGRPIVGFDPRALTLLSEYSWPGNYTQLKRVINSLCTLESTSYITASSVKKALEQEQFSEDAKDTPAPVSGSHLNLDRTLEEISRDIVQQVLEKNGGNQSAAARSLGISRTTLWRYLK